jgi:hypothetical protein
VPRRPIFVRRCQAIVISSRAIISTTPICAPSQQRRAASSSWRVDDLFLAHVAFTDIDGGTLHTARRLNCAGPGLAGASLEPGCLPQHITQTQS